MLSIYNIFKGNFPWWKHQPFPYGIEVETETLTMGDYPKYLVDAFDYPSSYTDPSGNTHTTWPKFPLVQWKAMDDGSLRDFGVEYVLEKPLSYDSALKALLEFEEVLKDVKFKKKTPSTSVHIHVNMLNEVPLTLANMLAIWTMFENVLLEYCGPSRRTNLFAAPIRVTEGIRNNFVSMLHQLEKGSSSAISWGQESVKYAACNIATLNKFGSLEFRPMRGTTDVKEISEWLGIINKIYLYSKRPGLTPPKLLEDYRELGPSILFKVFEEYAHKLADDALSPMLERNEEYVMDLCMAVKSWDTFGMAYMKPKLEPKTKLGTKKSPLDQFISLAQAQPTPWTMVTDNNLGGLPTFDEPAEQEF